MKDIVIIGGMGPQASLDLHKRILDKAAKNGAIMGQDYPLIRHISIPVPDFYKNESKKARALEVIKSNLEHIYLWRGYKGNFRLQHSPHVNAGTK